MATSENLGLYLPTRDDYISVKRDISDNMEIIDEAVGANTSGVSNIESGLAYVAVKVGNNWQIPSGKTAQIGDYVVVNGVFGHATAVLTGGSTNIVENTNWVAETNGVLNSLSTRISNSESIFINSAVNLDTLMCDNAKYIKRWRGDTCANLTNCPSNMAIPWELTVGVVGSNINYQYQEFRLYQNGTQAGSKIYRRQKYYYGVNDFRWNNWVEVPVVSSSVTVPASGTASFLLPSDGVYLVTGFGSAVAINNVAFLIGGYVTASRCSVVNLTGQTTVTINSSNTSSLTFVVSNGQANNNITLNIIKLA